MENSKIIATFTYPSEYAVLRLLLQQNNIRFVFQNETMNSILPFHSDTIGGICLKVHQDDITLAQEIIKNLDNTSELRIV